HTIQFLLCPRSLDHCSDGVLVPLRRVFNARGKHEQLAFLDDDVLLYSFLDHLQTHRTLQLIEDLQSLLQMVVPPLIWTPDEEHLQLIRIHALVADWRNKVLLVVQNPSLHVDHLRHRLSN
ncbi:hypothetical protein PMAYCL1PPCAC_28689, partial [Pristionchus mayeri]